MGIEYISRKELSRRLNVTPAAVTKMVRNGRVKMEGDVIVWNTADAKNFKVRPNKLREEKKKPIPITKPKEVVQKKEKPEKEKSETVQNQKPLPKREVESQSFEEPESDYARLTRAKADDQEESARGRKLKNDKEAGELLERSYIRPIIEQIANHVKVSLFSIPDRICGELAGMKDQNDVHAVLIREFTQVVEGMSSGIEDSKI